MKIVFLSLICTFICFFGCAASGPETNGSKEYPLVKASPVKTEGNETGSGKKSPEEGIWEGKVEKFSIKWTNKDIYIVQLDDESVNFAFSRIVIEKLKKLAEVSLSIHPEDKGETIELRASAKIKSILGSLVSFEIDYLATDKYRPVTNTEWVTLDLSKDSVFEDFDRSIKHALEFDDDYVSTALPISVKLYFSDKELLRSLLKNSQIRDSIKSEIKRKPRTLDEIINLDWIEVEKNDYPDRTFFSPDSLNNFMFEKIDNGKLVTRLQVYPDGDNKDEISSIKINLPLNNQVDQRLHSSNTMLFQNGFDAFADKQTEITLQTKVGE